MLLRRARGALLVSISVVASAVEPALTMTFFAQEATPAPALAFVPLAPRATLLPAALITVRKTSALVAVKASLAPLFAAVPLSPRTPVPPAAPLIAPLAPVKTSPGARTTLLPPVIGPEATPIATTALKPALTTFVPLPPRATLLPPALSVPGTAALVAATVTVETSLAPLFAAVPLPPLVGALTPSKTSPGARTTLLPPVIGPEVTPIATTALKPALTTFVPLPPRATLLPAALIAVRKTSALVATTVTIETSLTTTVAFVPLPPRTPVPPAAPLIAPLAPVKTSPGARTTLLPPVIGPEATPSALKPAFAPAAAAGTAVCLALPVRARAPIEPVAIGAPCMAFVCSAGVSLFVAAGVIVVSHAACHPLDFLSLDHTNQPPLPRRRLGLRAA